MAKSNNVRITEEAHRILVEKSEEHDMSMKEVASEAIIALFRREHRERRLFADYRRYGFGLLAEGAIVGGLVMFFLGAII